MNKLQLENLLKKNAHLNSGTALFQIKHKGLKSNPDYWYERGINSRNEIIISLFKSLQDIQHANGDPDGDDYITTEARAAINKLLQDLK